MTTFTEMFPRADVTPMSEDFVMVDYPAFTYLHAVDSKSKPISADKGGRHLGEAVPGIAVPFPTRTHGMLHKHFGLGTYEGGDGGEAGEPFAYGKGASLTSHARAKEFLAAAMIGDTIIFNGRRYIIERRPNDNIALVPAEETS